jgi:uncharacterized protein (TIGR03000 family)
MTKPEDGKKSGASAGRARVIVQVPDGARLYVQGQKVAVTKDNNSFVTPMLDAGARYAYTMRVEADVDGQTVSETKQVMVEAGSSVEVNFNQALVETPTDRARLVVKLPKNANLFVDGVKLEGNQPVRSFNTPTLEQGTEYVYTIKAELNRDGKAISDSKQVHIRAGKKFEVDFSNLGQVQAVSR